MIRKIKIYCGVLIALFIYAGRPCFAALQTGYQEDWNISGDLGGWQPNTTVTSTVVIDANGNPGGYLKSSGTAAGSFDVGAVTAIPAVTGDFRGAVWRVSVDVKFVTGNFDNLWVRFRYKDFTENGWVYPLANSFPLGTWQIFTVTFDPNWTDDEARARGWLTDQVISPSAIPSQSWNITMSDVYTAEVRVSGEGSLEAGIDNFHLEKVNLPVRNPSCCVRVEYDAARNSWWCYKN